MASSKVREQVESYFRELNYASSRIVEDMSIIRQAHGDDWDRISEKKKTEIAWEALVGPDIKEKYNYYPKQYAEVEVFPVIGLNTGDRMISDEDATNARTTKTGCWRDEHSAPFNWETQSQLNMRIFDSVDEVDRKDGTEDSVTDVPVNEQQTCGLASQRATVAPCSAESKNLGSTAVKVDNNVTNGVGAVKTSTFKPCLVSSSASEPNVGRVASPKPDTSTNTLDGSGLKHVKFSNGVESRVPPAAQNRGESRAVVGGSLPRVIHADPKVQASSSATEAKILEPRPPPPSRSQESVCSITSRGSSNPPTPVERKGRRRAPTPPKAPPPDPPRPKTAPPKPPAAATHNQKPPEAPRKHPSSKPPAPPIPMVKSPTREVVPRPTEKEALVEATPVRPPRLPSPPKDDPKDSAKSPKEPMAVRSPEGIPKTGFDFLDNW